MKHLTFKDVVTQGFNKVIVQTFGFEEGRIFPVWQPFGKKKDIVFRIVVLHKERGEAYLEHSTFFLKENEDKLDYILKDGRVYLDDPLLGADIEL